MKNKVFSTMLLGAAVPMLTGEAAEFIPLSEVTGTVYSTAIDLSADGKTLLGLGQTDAGFQLFRWSLDIGYSVLPSFDPRTFNPNFSATSISGDGSSVAGFTYDGASYAGLKWSVDQGFTYLGFLPPDSTAGMAFPVGISDDGGAIALYGTSPNTPYSAALMWTSSLGLVPLGFLPGDEPDAANFSQSFSWGISGDGQVVVGSSFSTRNTDHGDQAFRWTAGTGMEPLGFLAGEATSSATTVSVDGSVVVGMSGMYAFRWTEESGMENIGSFTPSAVSADGNTIVGTSFGQDQALIWTAETSLQPLKDYLQNNNVSVPWESLLDAAAISNDGRVIAGTGLNAEGIEEAFIATLPGQATVERAGAVTYAGAVSLYLVDPTGSRYGIDPVTGGSFSEIADLTLTEDGSLKTAAWPDFAGGEHLVHLTGSSAGSYQLAFDFLHLDNEASGAAFSGELLEGGLHVYAATVSTDAAEGASYRLVYADTDGDKVEDSLDAVPRSDVRPTVVIDGIITTVNNKVLADGTTLNDAIACLAAAADNRGQFVSGMNRMTKVWVSAGIISKSEADAIHYAITGDGTTELTILKRVSLEPLVQGIDPLRSGAEKRRSVRGKR